MIRRAVISDLDTLLGLDVHIERDEYESKIHSGRVLVYEVEGQIIGWLRYNMFWDQIPFLTLLSVVDQHQGLGYGHALMNYWETEMMALGHYMVMTSSLADEDAQHFYRKFGYVDSGNVLVPGETLELIFVKSITR